jgi:chromosome segregation ATPase
MSVLSDLFNLAKRVVGLADDLQRYQGEIKEIRKELRDLTLAVHAIAQELKHAKERTDDVHARILLEVENRLLRLGRELPPSSDEEGTKK